jgi:hypothetical protein
VIFHRLFVVEDFAGRELGPRFPVGSGPEKKKIIFRVESNFNHKDNSKKLLYPIWFNVKQIRFLNSFEINLLEIHSK